MLRQPELHQMQRRTMRLLRLFQKSTPRRRIRIRVEHHRRPTLVGGGKALRGAELPLQDVRRVSDLPAARAGEVAAENPLEHEDERKPLAPSEPGPTSRLGIRILGKITPRFEPASAGPP